MVGLKSPPADRTDDRLNNRTTDLKITHKPSVERSQKLAPSITISPWSDSVQTILDQPASTLPLKLAFASLLFLSSFMAWAWFGQVDEVAKAPGKIGPQDAAVKVQPVELGKVAQLTVKEGDTVQKGQVLAALESELDTKSVEQLQTVLMAQQGELSQTQVMVEKMRSQLETRSFIAQSDLQSQAATVSQNESMAHTQVSLNRQLGEEIAVQRQRIEKFRILASEGAYPRDQVTQMEQAVRERERNITEVDGKLQQAIGDRARLKAERDRKQSEAKQVQLSTQQEIEQLHLRQAEIRGKMQEAQAQIATAKAKKDQRYVYAPASGIVTTLNLKHSGQVVQPGESIAEISPQGKPLILSTLLPSQEAGFVKPGMTTQIKLDAFPYQDFGLVSGKVLAVSPDSKTLENGSQVYRVDIALDRPHINVRGQKIELKTGQTGTAEIMTRRRRVMDLLLDPIRKLQGNVSL